jgi:hypothetical protein
MAVAVAAAPSVSKKGAGKVYLSKVVQGPSHPYPLDPILPSKYPFHLWDFIAGFGTWHFPIATLDNGEHHSIGNSVERNNNGIVLKTNASEYFSRRDSSPSRSSSGTIASATTFAPTSADLELGATLRKAWMELATTGSRPLLSMSFACLE